jgi:hypothetical protein
MVTFGTMLDMKVLKRKNHSFGMVGLMRLLALKIVSLSVPGGPELGLRSARKASLALKAWFQARP